MVNNSGYVKQKNAVPNTAGEIVKQDFTSGAAHVAQRAGTGLQSYIYSFTTGTTREEIHFPVGASISEITVICSLNAGSATNNHAKGMLAIDAETDVDAGNILTGTTWPDSTSAQQRFYPIPLDTPMTIPLSSVMVSGDNETGRLDMRSSVAVDLDWWILAN